MNKPSIIFQTPAKLNLFLYVLGRRADGYHELESLMAKISLADEIRLSFTGNKDILTVSNNLCAPLGNDFATTDNLILKAVIAFRQRVKNDIPPIKIHLEKNIPLGAGLGGGSSNAAGTLVALNDYCGQPLSGDELLTLGLTLGADVPFFLNPATLLLVKGVGEIFQDAPASLLKMPSRKILLLNPGLHISTAGVFKHLGLTKGEVNNRIPRLGDRELGFNSLYPVALDCNRSLGQVYDLLKGTDPLYFGLSGSGSTFWATYPSETAHQAALESLSRQEPGYWLQETEFLRSSNF